MTFAGRFIREYEADDESNRFDKTEIVEGETYYFSKWLTLARYPLG